MSVVQSVPKLISIRLKAAKVDPVFMNESGRSTMKDTTFYDESLAAINKILTKPWNRFSPIQSFSATWHKSTAAIRSSSKMQW